MLSLTLFSPWPLGAFSEGKIKRFDIFTTLLADLAAKLHRKCLNMVFTYPASFIHNQHIELPLGLTTSQVEAEIQAKVKRDLPGMHDALRIDFSELPSKNAGYAHYFFTAAREDYLSQCVESLKVAGFKLKVVDVDYYALIRAVCFALQWQPKREKIYAIIQILKEQVVLIIFNADEILFHEGIEKNETENMLMLSSQRLDVNIDTLIVCSDQEYFNEIKSKTTAHCRFILYCPFPFAEIKAESFIAFGAALREVPAW